VRWGSRRGPQALATSSGCYALPLQHFACPRMSVHAILQLPQLGSANYRISAHNTQPILCQVFNTSCWPPNSAGDLCVQARCHTSSQELLNTFAIPKDCSSLNCCINLIAFWQMLPVLQPPAVPLQGRCGQGGAAATAPIQAHHHLLRETAAIKGPMWLN
jgi:hypothetical protein